MQVHAALAIVDISGYTDFVHRRAVSLEHAEAIVTELLESVLDSVAPPLAVNKLEGDAVLLWAELPATGFSEEMRRVIGQVVGYFDAFCAVRERIRASRRNCLCDACQSVEGLALKAFVHRGTIVRKRVRQFCELAGEAVILVHRMLKNDVRSREYVLVTGSVAEALANVREEFEAIDLRPEGRPPVRSWWASADVEGRRRIARMLSA